MKEEKVIHEYSNLRIKPACSTRANRVAAFD